MSKWKSIFSARELYRILVAWLVISASFSTAEIFAFGYSLQLIITAVLISGLSVGVGFIAHELAHKLLASKYGCWAEFDISPMGLVLALFTAIATRGSFILAAPGAVHIEPKPGVLLTERNLGLIAIVGPLANIGVAIVFQSFPQSDLFLRIVSAQGFQINVWLALFNLIPAGPLDGAKVFSWSKVIWAAAFFPLLMIFYFIFL